MRSSESIFYEKRLSFGVLDQREREREIDHRPFTCCVFVKRFIIRLFYHFYRRLSVIKKRNKSSRLIRKAFGEERKKTFDDFPRIRGGPSDHLSPSDERAQRGESVRSRLEQTQSRVRVRRQKCEHETFKKATQRRELSATDRVDSRFRFVSDVRAQRENFRGWTVLGRERVTSAHV